MDPTIKLPIQGLYPFVSSAVTGGIKGLDYSFEDKEMTFHFQGGTTFSSSFATNNVTGVVYPDEGVMRDSEGRVLFEGFLSGTTNPMSFFLVASTLQSATFTDQADRLVYGDWEPLLEEAIDDVGQDNPRSLLSGIEMGDGLVEDTLVFNSMSSEFGYREGRGERIEILPEGGNGATIQISGVETVEFTDRTIDVDQDIPKETAEKILLLYEAGLNRDGSVADSGLNFWIDGLESGTSMQGIARAFLDSDEFENAFGAPDSLSDRGLVVQLYTNVLDRAPEKPGEDFWTDRVGQDDFTREDLLIAFADSSENRDNSRSLLNSLNKVMPGEWSTKSIAVSPDADKETIDPPGDTDFLVSLEDETLANGGDFTIRGFDSSGDTIVFSGIGVPFGSNLEDLANEEVGIDGQRVTVTATQSAGEKWVSADFGRGPDGSAVTLDIYGDFPGLDDPADVDILFSLI